MRRSSRALAGVAVVVVTTGCRTVASAPAAEPLPQPSSPTPAGQVTIQPGTGTLPVGSGGTVTAPKVEPLRHVQADVEFMQGMIPHHAQAIRMATMAATHTTSRDVRVLAERIGVAQRDEIQLMQTWLRDKGERVPDSTATRHRHVMGGMEHEMLMPGMLTDEELAQLDRARNLEFDRLFLTFMIRHHEGAIAMVRTLFGSPGAGQDERVFRFATDVEVDQAEEIHRMQKMLEARPPS